VFKNIFFFVQVSDPVANSADSASVSISPIHQTMIDNMTFVAGATTTTTTTTTTMKKVNADAPLDGLDDQGTTFLFL
jgi:hypothetical protein